MAWIPVGLYALWSLVSFPRPLTRHRFKRGSMLSSGFLVFAATAARVAGFVGSDRFPDGGTHWIFVAILCAAGVVQLRMILGWLRALPKSWRVGADQRCQVRHRPAAAGRPPPALQRRHLVPGRTIPGWGSVHRHEQSASARGESPLALHRRS